MFVKSPSGWEVGINRIEVTAHKEKIRSTTEKSGCPGVTVQDKK